MSNEKETPPKAPERATPYETPAIVWEEGLPQGPNLFSACGKIEGVSGPCSAAVSS